MTKRRMCIIGNSGIACIKQAYEHCIEKYSNVDITFYGSSAYSISSLKLSNDGRTLVSDDQKVLSQLRLTSGGMDSISLVDYDEVVLYGITFEWRDFLRIFRTHCLPSQSNSLRAHQLLTISTLNAVIEDIIQLRPGSRLSSDIAGVVDAEITIASAPAPAEFVLDTAQFRKFSTFSHEIMSDIFEMYSHAFIDFCNARKFRPVLQDIETMAESRFTLSQYALGAVGLPQDGDLAIRSGKLFRDVNENDPWHMNLEFGINTLSCILSR